MAAGTDLTDPKGAETHPGPDTALENAGGEFVTGAGPVPPGNLAVFLDYLPVAAWMKDAEGRYIICNRSFEQMMDMPRCEILGKTDFDIRDKATAEIVIREDLLTMMSSSPLKFETVRNPQKQHHPLKNFEITKIAIRSPTGALTGIAAVVQEISERTGILQVLEEQVAVLQKAAMEDPIVGMLNRQSVMFDIHQALLTRKSTGTGFELVLVELQAHRLRDDVGVNQVPLTVLQVFGQKLRRSISPADRFGYLGQSQFAIVVRDQLRDDAVVSLIRRLTDLQQMMVEENGEKYRIQAHIAHVSPNDTDQTGDDILARAAQALQVSVPSGANDSSVANHPAPSGFELEADVSDGILRKEFIAHFQPKIDLATQMVVGAEALVRWKHPRLGLIPPSMFLPMAEKTGRLKCINTQIWRDAMKFALRLNEGSADARRVAINISHVDLQMPEFIGSVKDLLDATGCPAAYIEFEITEAAMKNRSEQLDQHLAALGAIGINIAIDDFGTGNLAFDTLNRFAIGTLKIDRVFVREIATNPRTAQLVKGMCLMANELGLITVAEGVETLMESELVKQVGCKHGQGFFWQRPVQADPFFEWLHQQQPFAPVA